MEYFSAEQRNLEFAATWRDIRIIMLIELASQEDDLCHMSSLTRGSLKEEVKSQMVLTKGWVGHWEERGEGKGGSLGFKLLRKLF